MRCFLAVLLIHVATSYADPTLGPGRGPWRKDRPETHGIPRRELLSAVREVGGIIHRYCLLIARGGALVEETYFSGDAATKYETDSEAKTMIGALVGAVWTHRRWDLDTPVRSLGVDTSFAGRWSGDITTRHILGQTTGRGRMPPGVAMTYDSDDFIQLLSPLLGKLLEPDNITVMDFAEKRFAVPLGIRGVFDGDRYIGGGNVSMGGGQHMTCQQIARVGQLIMNRGRWNDEHGEPFVLVDPEWVWTAPSPTRGCITQKISPADHQRPLVSGHHDDGAFFYRCRHHLRLSDLDQWPGGSSGLLLRAAMVLCRRSPAVAVARVRRYVDARDHRR